MPNELTLTLSVCVNLVQFTRIEHARSPTQPPGIVKVMLQVGINDARAREQNSTSTKKKKKAKQKFRSRARDTFHSR